ncbi:DNA polymerase V [Erwinia phyllosphaerae]|uniref:DNA polymerase V n=1 Tax=Erwinia phyllosphaerae TaxID=2853256 RepID=UPI001FED95BE|nr:DNA polymerase V [Erwinia phyllosphaerae]MBV4366311.1 DNA polymerase V [Erwinia phyllosphaerae]
MARYDDIGTAYRESIRISMAGRRTVTTVDFVQALARYNHIWTLKEANEWIEQYQWNFKDVSTEEGEQRTFQLYNIN